MCQAFCHQEKCFVQNSSFKNAIYSSDSCVLLVLLSPTSIPTAQTQRNHTFEPDASGLSYHCTPSVCVPAVNGGLAVWQHNNNKTKKNIAGVPFDSVRRFRASFWFLVCNAVTQLALQLQQERISKLGTSIGMMSGSSFTTTYATHAC